MATCRCPNDAMRIPLVAEVLDLPKPVRLFWCWSCMELFAFVGDNQFAAGFANNGKGGWTVFRSPGTAEDVALAISAASHLHPDSVPLRH